MIYKFRDNRLKITDSVLEGFIQHRQVGSTDLESGGVLLGRFIQESKDIVIDNYTKPLPGDVRKPCFFKKDLNNHQKIVDEIWKESSGTCHYLGEWHTHPENHPTPSLHDRREWKKVLKQTVTDSDKLFFIIVGTKSIGVWVGCRPCLKINKIEKG